VSHKEKAEKQKAKNLVAAANSIIHSYIAFFVEHVQLKSNLNCINHEKTGSFFES